MERTLIKAVVIAAVLTTSVGTQAAWAKRQYDAGRMRFMQRDPLGQEHGVDPYVIHAEGMNLYEYLGSAPANHTDPKGLIGIPSILTYGNYCGPFHGSPNQEACAVDCMDSACCLHDGCYGTAGGLRIVLHLLGITYDRELRRCDRALCNQTLCCAGLSSEGRLYLAGLRFVFSCHSRYGIFIPACRPEGPVPCGQTCSQCSCQVPVWY